MRGAGLRRCNVLARQLEYRIGSGRTAKEPVELDQRYKLILDGACAGIPDGICKGGGLVTQGNNLTPLAQLANPSLTATNPQSP